VNKLFLFSFLFFIGNTYAQQLKTDDETFSINNLVFNQDFIAENNIKQIVASNSTKSDGQPLKQGKEYYYWQFDSQGRTIGQGRTVENTLTKVADTLHNVMRYDKYERLIYKTERMGERLKSFHYKYNQKGKLLRTDIKERKNYGTGLGFVNSIDSFAYKNISDSSYICNTHNENGSNYREQIYVFDSSNRIIEKSGRYLRGDVRTKELYAYDPNGYLNEKTIYQDIRNENFEKSVLHHDKIGNVHKIKTYRKDENQNVVDIIYFEDTILLKAIIVKDVETHDLNILKFEYEYFELELLEN